jgi:membrane-bound lytic murein transglycosylase A
VFFKIEPNGPLGNINVPLTAGRSLALDRRLFPPAALAFIETEKPLVDGSGRIAGWTACRRFMLNQDTGGAIKGPGRADLFWGSGPYAEIAAGYMKNSGKLYFLVLKPDA